jgi:hypothetical protein
VGADALTLTPEDKQRVRPNCDHVPVQDSTGPARPLHGERSGRLALQDLLRHRAGKVGRPPGRIHNDVALRGLDKRRSGGRVEGDRQIVGHDIELLPLVGAIEVSLGDGGQCLA